jgi:BirA family biotin operon repressor/biotin-[acetyl-CoA-carboxylase] ligase
MKIYRLNQDKGVHLSIEGLKRELVSVFREGVFKRVIFYESTTSTNDRAMEIGDRERDADGIVVVADTQTHGRGRHGRSWISPPGSNLYFTVLLRPPFPPDRASLFIVMTAVAMTSALRKYTGLDVRIKWPNDMLINGRKVGGILMEMRSDRDRINFVVMGIGINVNLAPDIPQEQMLLPATSLKEECGRDLNRSELLREALSELGYRYKLLLKGDKETLINEWLELDSTIGKRVRIQNMAFSATQGSSEKVRDGVILGIAEGIDGCGRLILRLASGRIETISAGDVTILKGQDQN